MREDAIRFVQSVPCDITMRLISPMALRTRSSPRRLLARLFSTVLISFVHQFRVNKTFRED